MEENKNLTYYTFFENLTRPTDDWSFPFLMCEIKYNNRLDYADRQNMHSCNVAVKALLKLEQKADQYREGNQFESLLGKILVYSISHNQSAARVYRHYALVEGENWRYYRHYIERFDIGHKESDLPALHNSARNVLTVHAPKLLKRLQKVIAALQVGLIYAIIYTIIVCRYDGLGGQLAARLPTVGVDKIISIILSREGLQVPYIHEVLS